MSTRLLWRCLRRHWASYLALVVIVGVCASSVASDDVGRFPTVEPVRQAAAIEPIESAVVIQPTPEPLHEFSNVDAPVAQKATGYSMQPSHGFDQTMHWPDGCLFTQDWFTHGDPDDPARHIGLGVPLVGTSWLNRPHYTTLLVGSMIADDIRGNAELHNGYFLSLQQGWDFDHYYGAELRLSGGSYDVVNSPNNSNANLFFADANLLHYPWGDALWRPYLSIGAGLGQVHVRANNGRVFNETVLNIPLGIGLKYQWKRHCVMRFDIRHNLAFGDGLDVMDHVSLAYGFEYRYGARPKSYYPWNPSIYHH